MHKDATDIIQSLIKDFIIFSLVLSQSKFNNWIKARKKYKKNYLDKIYISEK